MTRTKVVPLLIGFAALTFANTNINAFASPTEFSDWTSASGRGHIEYRWRRDGTETYSGCDVEMRNLDEADRQTYKAKIGYVHGGRDDTSGIESLSFPYSGYTYKTTTYGTCDRVTDLLILKY